MRLCHLVSLTRWIIDGETRLSRDLSRVAEVRNAQNILYSDLNPWLDLNKPYCSQFIGQFNGHKEGCYTKATFKKTICVVSQTGIPRLVAIDDVFEMLIPTAWRTDRQNGLRGIDSSFIGKGWYKFGIKVSIMQIF